MWITCTVGHTEWSRGKTIEVKVILLQTGSVMNNMLTDSVFWGFLGAGSENICLKQTSDVVVPLLFSLKFAGSDVIQPHCIWGPLPTKLFKIMLFLEN